MFVDIGVSDKLYANIQDLMDLDTLSNFYHPYPKKTKVSRKMVEI